MRFIASALAGEGIDSLVFMSVGFLGVLAASDLVNTTLTLWVVKVLYQMLLLPLSIRVTNWVKTVERTDKIDVPEDTNYNPFAVFGSRTAIGRGKKWARER
jgi:uncharacterized PurR-regulated membrane protein YhhQ (DUF165 family)